MLDRTNTDSTCLLPQRAIPSSRDNISGHEVSCIVMYAYIGGTRQFAVPELKSRLPRRSSREWQRGVYQIFFRSRWKNRHTRMHACTYAR